MSEHLTQSDMTETDLIYETCDLRSDIKLVYGASRAALYDLDAGNVYSINTDAARIITGEVSDASFWETLDGLGLVRGDEQHDPKECLSREETDNSSLSFAWLEVTPDCNETCIHCYGLFGRPQEVNELLDFEEWTGVLEQISEMGCKNIQFIGGEPFMYKDREMGKNLIDLIIYARQHGLASIEVFTNGTMLTDRTVRILKDLEVSVAISIYSSNPDIHDHITQLSGSHQLTMRGMEKLKEAGIPVRVGFVAMYQNEETIGKTAEMFKDLGLRRYKPDVIRPSGGGKDLSLQPNLDTQKAYGLQMRPNFRVDQRMYDRHKKSNPCLSGKLAVSYSGNVFPCIFSRAFPVGNIREQSIKDIIQDKAVQQIWETTKDDVLVCQDCEYRYACHDCRPLSLNTNPDGNYLTAPPARCTYNPYEGIWSEGLWRLNCDGDPAYIPLKEVFDE